MTDDNGPRGLSVAFWLCIVLLPVYLIFGRIIWLIVSHVAGR